MDVTRLILPDDVWGFYIRLMERVRVLLSMRKTAPI